MWVNGTETLQEDAKSQTCGYEDNEFKVLCPVAEDGEKGGMGTAGGGFTTAKKG